MAELANLARMTTLTVGTGTITLNAAANACLTFAEAGITDGQTVSYAIEDGENSEVGRGVYTHATLQLTRSVLLSTNSNSAINLSGEAEVFITALAEDIRFSGAVVKKAIDQTAANYTSFTAVAWDAEHFDTDGYHDNSVNNTRLTVPSSVKTGFVRVSACIRSSSGTADTHRSAYIRQDGSTIVGIIEANEGGSSANGIIVTSRPVAVVPGTTYFEVLFNQETDNSITINSTDSWFAIEALG